jgi:hypothetical protein
MYRQEGLLGFFRGTNVAIIKNGVGSAVFFTGLQNIGTILDYYLPKI